MARLCEKNEGGDNGEMSLMDSGAFPRFEYIRKNVVFYMCKWL